jgi:hypothetical protein
MSWGGLSHDPVGGLVIANLPPILLVITLVPRDQLQGEWANIPTHLLRRYLEQRGTPYAVRVDLLMSLVASHGNRWPRVHRGSARQGFRLPT